MTNSAAVLRTGVQVQAGVYPSGEADRISWTRLFHEGSTTPLSHNVSADQFGLLLQAFGLQGTDKLCLEMVVGCKDGTYFEPVKPCDGCAPICLSACRNMLFIPMPGRFRLRYTGSRLGLFQAFVTPVPFEHFAAMAHFASGWCPSPAPTVVVEIPEPPPAPTPPPWVVV